MRNTPPDDLELRDVRMVDGSIRKDYNASTDKTPMKPAGTPISNPVAWGEYVAELVAEVVRLRQERITILVNYYKANSADCARLCDEVLDPSGTLLDIIRKEIHNES